MRIEICWCVTQSIPDADRSFQRHGCLSINPSNSASSNRWITAARRLWLCEMFSLFQVPRGAGRATRGIHPGDEDNWPALCLKWSLLMVQRSFISWCFSYKPHLELPENACENAAQPQRASFVTPYGRRRQTQGPPSQRARPQLLSPDETLNLSTLGYEENNTMFFCLFVFFSSCRNNLNNCFKIRKLRRCYTRLFDVEKQRQGASLSKFSSFWPAI